VDTFVKKARRFWGHPPLLLVDGYDEIGKNDNREYETAVIRKKSSIISCFGDCTQIRMVLGLREEMVYRTITMRQSESKMEMDTDLGVYAQFERFKNQHYPNARHLHLEKLSAWQSAVVKEYAWQHPYINAFLFDRALSKPEEPFPYVNRDDLEECCLHLINRDRHKTLSNAGFERLQQIAQKLEPAWTDRGLLTIGINQTQINELFDFGTIDNLQTGKRKIIDGLRELLRNL
jgi:hypothetical protein